jgi:hypothetical protein
MAMKAMPTRYEMTASGSMMKMYCYKNDGQYKRIRHIKNAVGQVDAFLQLYVLWCQIK